MLQRSATLELIRYVLDDFTRYVTRLNIHVWCLGVTGCGMQTSRITIELNVDGFAGSFVLINKLQSAPNYVMLEITNEVTGYELVETYTRQNRTDALWICSRERDGKWICITCTRMFGERKG